MKLAFNTWAYSSFPSGSRPTPSRRRSAASRGSATTASRSGPPRPRLPGLHWRRAAAGDQASARRQQHRRLRHAPRPGRRPRLNVASPMPEERRDAIEQYKEVAQLCADLGGDTLLYVAGWQIFGTTSGAGLGVEPRGAGRDRPGGGRPRCDHRHRANPDRQQSYRERRRRARVGPGSRRAERKDDVRHHPRLLPQRGPLRTMSTVWATCSIRPPLRRRPPRAGPGPRRFRRPDRRRCRTSVTTDSSSMEIGFNRRDVEPDKVARDAYQYIKPLLG